MRISPLLVTVSVLLASPLSAQGAWKFDAGTDPMDDSNRNSVFIIANEGKGLVGVRCMSDGMNVQLNLDKYFVGDEGTIKVAIRFDSGKVIDGMDWVQSTDRTAAFLPMEGVKDFVTLLKASSKLAVRATDPSDGEQLTFTFNLYGFSAVYPKLKDCL